MASGTRGAHPTPRLKGGHVFEGEWWPAGGQAEMDGHRAELLDEELKVVGEQTEGFSLADVVEGSG